MPDFDEPRFRDALFRNKKKKGKYRIVEPPLPRLESCIADTHAHLDLLNDAPLALARCAAFRVRFVCSIADVHEDDSTTYDQLDTWLEEAASTIPEIMANGSYEATTAEESFSLPNVRVAIGCHPHNALHYDAGLEKKLTERLHDSRTCALGEVGLDFHYLHSPKEDQVRAFRHQIRLAHEAGLPLILHIRKAHDLAWEILQEEGFPKAGTLLHCYTLDWPTLSPWVEKGCYVAFGGALTFAKNDAIREAARYMDTGRLLTETDCPYMAPEPMRGMECGPEHVIFVAARLAKTCAYEPGETRREFLDHVYGNALALLDRPPTAWQQGKAV